MRMAQITSRGPSRFARIAAMTLSLGLGALSAGPTGAAQPSPVGYWRTVPDDGAAPATIQIWLEAGKLFGKIVGIEARPGIDPNAKCERCEGALKNRPIRDLIIIQGLSPSGDEWTGGTILDPGNGKSYRCKIQVLQGGAKLKVRGYIGFALLGRTQIWVRAEAPAGPPPASATKTGH